MFYTVATALYDNLVNLVFVCATTNIAAKSATDE